jgi:hypothetical protein
MQLRIAAQSSQPVRKRAVRLPEQNVYERVEMRFTFMSLMARPVHAAANVRSLAAEIAFSCKCRYTPSSRFS